MRELEHRFPTELAIVGVHSGKYHAERVTERIREAAIRLGNAHPILNDRQFRTWRAYAVNAWPTLAIVDPTGRVLGNHAGEFTADELTPIVRQLADAENHAIRAVDLTTGAIRTVAGTGRQLRTREDQRNGEM